MGYEEALYGSLQMTGLHIEIKACKRSDFTGKAVHQLHWAS